MKTGRMMLAMMLACGVMAARGQEVHTWRYTTERPAEGWFKPGFDVSAWKEGKSVFGTHGTPGMNIRTIWNTPDIWLVRTFNVSEQHLKIPPFVRIIHDEDTEVYVNGVEVCKTKGFITAYRDIPATPELLKALKAGENTVAVHCFQTSGGQGIDVDIVFDMGQVVYPEAVEFARLALGRELKPEECETIGKLWDLIERENELLADWLRQDTGDLYGKGVFKDGAVRPNLAAAAEKAFAGEWADVFRQRLGIIPGAGDDLKVLLASYKNVCQLRRDHRLAKAGAQMPKVVFARHFVMGASHYAYTEALSDAQHERSWQAGGQLCLAEYQPGGFWKETVLLDSKEGIIRDVDVDFDGKRVLFAWKKSDRGDDYSLYEMPVGADGVPDASKVRQLTGGLGIADYEGCYLADGSIVFISTRCQQIVDCFYTEVSNMYRCDADGGNILRLGFDQVHVNYPVITWDNRVLYTRWEYNDRSQMYPQALFQMMPDGTAQSAVYGENSWFPTTIIHARCIPGSPNMFAVATGHHSRQPGELIYIEPGKGRQETEGITIVAPVREPPEKRPIVIDAYGQGGDLFMYPYPIDARQLLVTYNPTGWNQRNGTRREERKTGFGLYWMDIDGNRELLAPRMTLSTGRAVPLAPRRRPPERPSAVNYAKRDGTFYVQDVYVGEAMNDVPRGTVKTLRVIELDYRIAGIGNNGNGGPGGAADISTPVAIGNGAWDPKILVGDATVYPDGSVFFTTDARRPVYFMLLDDKGRMVQTMRSWTTLQSGENASCVGCHEPKNSVPLATARPTQALAAGAQKLAPIGGPRRGFSFVKEVQPILDRNCVKCHDGKEEKRPDFRATIVKDDHAKRNWTQSYLTLTHAKPDMKNPDRRYRGDPNHKGVNWVSAASAPPIQKPLTVGSNTSALFERLDKGHCKTIKPEEIATLALWVDLAVPFCADYVEANTWDENEMKKHEQYKAKRDAADKLDAETLGALGKR
ncbi:MAG: hypothetical protein FWG50_00645 [Kiritimatiellaeota bacterium]|nr:hypothetical protein [Kiritimatiellota bacterium]